MQMSVCWLVGLLVCPGSLCILSAYEGNRAYTIDGLIYPMMLINYFYQSIDGLIYWLIDWLINQLIDWLIFFKNNFFIFFKKKIQKFYFFSNLKKIKSLEVELFIALELSGCWQSIVYPLKVPFWVDGKAMSMEL